ncbi:MAG: LytTR family DNA-binding domain-containing protein [Bacteroidota bacterium]
MKGKNLALNLQYRPHLLLGLLLAIWLYAFLVLIGPFDAAELPIWIRSILMPGYSLVFFLAYALLIPIQNQLYHRLGNWKLGYEIALVAFFCLYALPLCFAYYKTGLVNGLFSFATFSLSIYLPTISVLIPVIIVGRYLIAQASIKRQGKASAKVNLIGDNKRDILSVSLDDLIAMEAANNYVAVYYLRQGEIKKQLLRTSLYKIHQSVPEMVQVHRSYLVNWQHFIAWKDSQSLELTQLSVPVSQKYKATLLSQAKSVPK